MYYYLLQLSSNDICNYVSAHDLFTDKIYQLYQIYQVGSVVKTSMILNIYYYIDRSYYQHQS